jgi:purine catabolism regulator
MPLIADADPEVLAGGEQLGRPIRWLHPAEVHDIAHLLRGDELVLTTGIFLSDDAHELDAYVDSLDRAGVAGIILELGRRWQTAPRGLVASCEARGIVLVQLRREVSFAAVVEELGSHILEEKLDDLRASEHIHETFTRLDLEAASLQQILDAVVTIARAPVVLESSRHQVIGYQSGSAAPTDVLNDWSRRSRAVATSGRTAYDQRSGWLVTVVSSRGDDWGRLVLMSPGLPSRRDYVLIERAAATLALQQMRVRVSDSLERNAHATLLAELKAGRVSHELTVRCEAANFPVAQRQFFAVAVQPRVNAETRPPLLSELAWTVSSAGRSLDVPLLVGIETDHVVALASIGRSREVDAAMSSLVRELSKVVDAVIAQGGAVASLDEAGQSVVEARSVLAAADPADDRPWITLADVHLHGLLHLLRDDERLHVFVRRELQSLLAHDRQRGTDLLGLLRVVLDTPGGKAAAAKRLLISRPVLYERLAKIQSVMGVDLEDPQVRTSLHIAVMARDLVDEASGSPGQSDNS